MSVNLQLRLRVRPLPKIFHLHLNIILLRYTLTFTRTLSGIRVRINSHGWLEYDQGLVTILYLPGSNDDYVMIFSDSMSVNDCLTDWLFIADCIGDRLQ